MSRFTRRTVTIAGATMLTAAALTGGGIAVAAAGSPAATQTQPGQPGNEQEPSYTGSVQAPPAPGDGQAGSDADGNDGDGNDGDGEEGEGSDGEQDSEGPETAESAALQGLATIKPDQARAAALAAVPGTADTAQLENENGSVVYSVQVTKADGTTTDVKIDAGNGTVLAQQTGDQDRDGE